MTTELSTIDKENDLQNLIKYSRFNKAKSTIKTHYYSLWDFVKFYAQKNNIILSDNKSDEISKIMARFCELDAIKAKFLVVDYLSFLVDKNQSTSTLATKLAAIKSHITYQKGMLGTPNWDLSFLQTPKVENEKVAGPSEEEFALLRNKFLELENSENYIDKRNALLCLIISMCAFRISEALSLNIENIDFKNSKLLISRKGKKLNQEFYIGKKLLSKIRKFLSFDKRESGPLFINQDKIKAKNNRLTRVSAYRIIKSIGESIGIENLHPHKFRHFGTTEGLEANDRNVHDTMKFTGHLTDEQIERYEDERDNKQLKTSIYIENKWL